jgi:hypothetical protein
MKLFNFLYINFHILELLISTFLKEFNNFINFSYYFLCYYFKKATFFILKKFEETFNYHLILFLMLLL